MKIKQIEIDNYGKFHHFSLELQNLQALYGRNEAGKSTMVSFILDMLFGFEKRSTSHPYGPKDKSKMSGGLTIEQQGQVFHLHRVDAKNGGDLTITDAAGKDQSADLLKKWLGPIDRKTYQNLFYFSFPDLGAVANLSKQKLNQLINRVGVVGVDEWLELAEKLEKEAKQLYAPRGRTRKLNQLLQEHEKLTKKAQTSQTDYPKYLENQQQEQVIATKRAENQKALTKVAADLPKLEDEQRLWNKYQQLQALRQQKLTGSAGFEPADLEASNKLQSSLEIASQNLEEQQKQVNSYQKQAPQQPEWYQFYIEHKRQIEQLAPQVESAAEQQRQLNQITTELQNDEEQLTTITQAAGGPQSKPFDQTTNQKTAELLQKQQALQQQELQLSQTPSQNPNTKPTPSWEWFGIAGGLLLILGAIFLGGVGLVIGGLLGLALLGISCYQLFGQQQKQGSASSTFPSATELQTQSAQVEQELTAIGRQFNISQVPMAQWTNVLQAKINQRDLQKAAFQKKQATQQHLQTALTQMLSAWQFAAQPFGLQANAPATQIQQLQRILAEAQDCAQKQSNYQQRLQELQQAATTALQKVEQLQRSQQQFWQQRQVDGRHSFEQKYKEQQQLKQKRMEQAELEQVLTPTVLASLKQYQDESALQQKISKLRQQRTELSTTGTQLAQEQAQLQRELQLQAKDGTFAEIRQQLANLETEIIQQTKIYFLNQLSHDWIEAVLNQANHGRFPQVQAQAQKYFAILTDQHYQKISYKNKMEVVTNDGFRFKVSELSRGTTQQLYLSLVLAFTSSFSDQYPMPIMVDDGFAEFDCVRTKHALELLKDLSKRTQVIYFTADERILQDDLMPATQTLLTNN
ncbi:DNA double-strand break repair ATPase [Fructilactobacillus florum 8D]|uniref:DNA double-strand break repair ATPase n=1 Tax=Fructilactobacillus florum 8D TaxID=1221538 RepID=W9EFS4_9LACO|nr:AAA family ATPase [Fructilactobacillus florum]ETO40126.1 DNA double-strand break repair ATPase [Fructilactobacillus florum 8D]